MSSAQFKNKTAKIKTQPLVLLLALAGAFSLTLFATSADAQSACGGSLTWTTAADSGRALDAAREKIRAQARHEGLPAFDIEIHGHWVPVVLLNRKTYPRWSSTLATTFGLSQSLNPDNIANHGYARLPGAAEYAAPFKAPGLIEYGETATAAQVDLFSPGRAGANAANGTGYRFKALSDYFQRREVHSTEFIDLAFTLSADDQRRIWLYHLAKRSALVRLQYRFDEPQNFWFTQQRRGLQRDGHPYADPHMGGFEHCNNSRCGAAADLHAQEIRGRLVGLLNKDTNVVFNSEDTRKFLTDAKRDLLFRDWRRGENMNPDFLNTPHYMGLMQAHFQTHLTHEDRVDALAYLLAVNIFEEVIRLRNHLGIEEGRANPYGNPNLTTVFIYSDQPARVDEFYRGDVTLASAPYQHGNNGFSSHYFRIRHIHIDRPSRAVQEGCTP